MGFIYQLVEYSKRTDNNVFRFLLVPYKSYCYIKWIDGGYFRKDFEEENRKGIDKATLNHAEPFCTWYKISKSSFQSGIRVPEPFRYFPEMNEKVKEK
jgi:hypothetical protein